jgi:hypothetical protein
MMQILHVGKLPKDDNTVFFLGGCAIAEFENGMGLYPIQAHRRLQLLRCY